MLDFALDIVIILLLLFIIWRLWPVLMRTSVTNIDIYGNPYIVG